MAYSSMRVWAYPLTDTDGHLTELCVSDQVSVAVYHLSWFTPVAWRRPVVPWFLCACQEDEFPTNGTEHPWCGGAHELERERTEQVEGQPGVPRRQLWVPARDCGSCGSRLQIGPSVGPGA